MTKKIDNDLARKITAPLVGIYELRLADAHLPSSKIDGAFALLDLDRDEPTIFQAHKILHLCVTSIYTIIDILSKWDEFDENK